MEKLREICSKTFTPEEKDGMLILHPVRSSSDPFGPTYGFVGAAIRIRHPPALRPMFLPGFLQAGTAGGGASTPARPQPAPMAAAL